MRTRNQYWKFARKRIVLFAGDAQICWMHPGDTWHEWIRAYVNGYRGNVRIPRSFRHMLEKTDD